MKFKRGRVVAFFQQRTSAQAARRKIFLFVCKRRNSNFVCLTRYRIQQCVVVYMSDIFHLFTPPIVKSYDEKCVIEMKDEK